MTIAASPSKLAQIIGIDLQESFKSESLWHYSLSGIGAPSGSVGDVF